MKSLKEQLSEIKEDIKNTKLVDQAGSSSEAFIIKHDGGYRTCPECKCVLKAKNYDKHNRTQHGNEIVGSKNEPLVVDQDEWIICEKCNKRLKKKSLKKHIKKVHLRKIYAETTPKIKKDKVKLSEPRKVINQKKLHAQNIRPSKRLENTRVKPRLSYENRQALLARINQGRFDSERKLVILVENASKRDEQEILKAVQQRLKKIYPEIYRRVVGPLYIRDPLGSKTCYCAVPTSLENITQDINKNRVPYEALQCDACWKEDIASAWGYYGWSRKIISIETWRGLCQERGENKFGTY